MSDMNTTPESERTKYNRRIREKRSKGHSFQMITSYAAGCSVPIDQLHDLTPEEQTEAERLRVEMKERAEREAEQRREWGRERDENGNIVPAKIDYEAVKDIPALDDAHRTNLARTNLLLRLHDKGGLYHDVSRFQVGQIKRQATANHEADPSKHLLEHFLRAWQETRDTDWKGLYEQHCKQEQERIEALKPKSLEQLFDVLAEQRIASVVIEFTTEDSVLSGNVETAWTVEGEEIDLDELPGNDEDNCFSTAIREFIEEEWEAYANEAIVGDTDRPRYAHEGTYFQGASGTVTFNITERRIDLKATASVEVISEEEEEVEESWDVGKTDSEAA